MIKNLCAVVGFIVILLWLAAALGLGNFVLIYGEPMVCTKKATP